MPLLSRTLAWTSGLGLVLLGFWMPSWATAQTLPERPNILWITVEDMSPRLPVYGDSTVETPHISRLAEEGIVYENAFVVAPVCAPSRASILT
ncbi:MAG: sulfatase-like hydrolase/transferase, partial [Rhodothermales bacterium]